MRARRRQLVARAGGDVLDLGGAESHRGLWAGASPASVTILDGVNDPRLRTLAAAGPRFDTIVSVLQLTSAVDLEVALRRIGALLQPEGEVLFLEPGRRTGLAGAAQQMAAPTLGLIAGWHVDRDIPAVMRSEGLSVTDLSRHSVPTVQFWLRRLVEGRAHLALRARRGDEPGPPSEPTATG